MKPSAVRGTEIRIAKYNTEKQNLTTHHTNRVTSLHNFEVGRLFSP